MKNAISRNVCLVIEGLHLKHVVDFVGLRGSGDETEEETNREGAETEGDANEPLHGSERGRGSEGTAPLHENDLDDEGANDDRREDEVVEEASKNVEFVV